MLSELFEGVKSWHSVELNGMKCICVYGVFAFQTQCESTFKGLQRLIWNLWKLHGSLRPEQQSVNTFRDL